MNNGLLAGIAARFVLALGLLAVAAVLPGWWGEIPGAVGAAVLITTVVRVYAIRRGRVPRPGYGPIPFAGKAGGYQVVLVKAPRDPRVAAVIRSSLDVRLGTAFHLIDHAPAVLVRGVGCAEAEELASRLEKVAAEVDVVDVGGAGTRGPEVAPDVPTG